MILIKDLIEELSSNKEFVSINKLNIFFSHLFHLQKNKTCILKKVHLSLTPLFLANCIIFPVVFVLTYIIEI
jgi:hypothetical protein